MRDRQNEGSSHRIRRGVAAAVGASIVVTALVVLVGEFSLLEGLGLGTLSSIVFATAAWRTVLIQEGRATEFERRWSQRPAVDRFSRWLLRSGSED
jgi:hypothetical protein